ncbi:MAG: thioesterase family protein [Chitinophagaceae bacterium]|jgi:acyl-CoA thioester hydrolase|nr:thioesterase family protein [Chitinophagaceae bacterium]
MQYFNRDVQVRWADLDPNFHVRHSVYYDWGAFCRIEYLYSVGLTTEVMQKFHIGPILFREECVFRKEIRLEDKVSIDLKLVKAKKDFSRWTIQHEIRKNGDILSAVLTVDIAWLDIVRRKLASLPEEVRVLFGDVPVADDFQWMD